MNAQERFAAYLAGRPVDRAPMVEWAPWWNLTIDRWHADGLPEDCKTVEDIQNFFGLDKCIQKFVTSKTARTPKPAGFGLGIMENEEDYEKIKPTLFPDPEKVIGDAYFDYLERTRERGDTIHFLSVEGFFWYPRTLFGIENHLYSFYDYPELYHRLCRDHTDWLKKLFSYVFSRFRFDFMTFAEDMSYNNGPMISKGLFDEFLAPYYKEIIPLIHSYGVPVILDSDGDITLAVDWYASVGVDGMLPLERQAGVDVSTYIAKQPDMAFIGHFDKMCMKFGEEAMRKEFERLLPSMKTGKLIPSVDHQTPPDVSIENYRIYMRLFREYCEKVTHGDGNITPCPVFLKKEQ